MSEAKKERFVIGEDNNYRIGGSLCNAFVLGDIGAKDDCYLIGAEPEEESNYPLLTGNILDSEGNVLFRLVRNEIVFNPGHCSKFISDSIGYEIHDSAGKLVFKVETRLEDLDEGEYWITNIHCNLYNKDGDLFFETYSNAAVISEVGKAALGFKKDGTFSATVGMSDKEIEIARNVLNNGGNIS